MRTVLLGLLLVFGASVLGASASAQRVQVSMNDGWRYADGPQPGAEAADFDDSDWQRVTLPHTWNADDAFDDTPGYRRGVGWYRKPFDVPAAWDGNRLFLYFEGANQVAEVFVGGERQGAHVGGYTAFSFDVTDAVASARSTRSPSASTTGTTPTSSR